MSGSGTRIPESMPERAASVHVWRDQPPDGLSPIGRNHDDGPAQDIHADESVHRVDRLSHQKPRDREASASDRERLAVDDDAENGGTADPLSRVVVGNPDEAWDGGCGELRSTAAAVQHRRDNVE